MSNTAKNGVTTLGGREFNRVKNGLDEAEVAVFIDELINERDKLAQSQHHIASLTKLAETTIIEADKLAKQIKTEATEQAKTESAAIIDKAKEEAQQMAEQKQAEALERAEQKANAIRSDAEREAAMLLDNERKRIWNELHNAVNQQFDYLMEKLGSIKQQAFLAEADFKNKTLQPPTESSAITVESEEGNGAAPIENEEESTAAVMELEQEVSAVAMEEGNIFYESLVPMEAMDQSEKSFDLAKLFQTEDQTDLGKPQFEVEILPPVQMTKIMEVVAHLDQLPEVENTEIIPRMDTPSILVFLRGEIDFVDALRTIPAVAYVEEVTTDADATNGEPVKAPKKIRIGLSGNIMSQERK